MRYRAKGKGGGDRFADASYRLSTCSVDGVGVGQFSSVFNQFDEKRISTT